MASSKLDPKPPPIDVWVASYDFEARSADELSMKEGQLIYLEANPTTDEWVAARAGLDSTFPSGLVPRPYIKPGKPLFQASVLYDFSRQRNDEISIKAGQTVFVYGHAGTYLLTKLGPLGRGNGSVGLVPPNYLQELSEGEVDDLGPVASKKLPPAFCAICEGAFDSSVRYECTECRLPNGCRFFVCGTCADYRQACVAHQLVKGPSHLFRRHLPDLNWICSNCKGSIKGAKSFFCVSCPAPSTVGYEICLRCFSNPQVPRHQHALITVTTDGVISKDHISSLVAQPPSYRSYACDGCRRTIRRYVFNCKRCPAPGYDLCSECVDMDRATYWHDRWTGGVPHEFEVIDQHIPT